MKITDLPVGKKYLNNHFQRAKKVLSNSPRLVDFIPHMPKREQAIIFLDFWGQKKGHLTHHQQMSVGEGAWSSVAWGDHQQAPKITMATLWVATTRYVTLRGLSGKQNSNTSTHLRGKSSEQHAWPLWESCKSTHVLQGPLGCPGIIRQNSNFPKVQTWKSISLHSYLVFQSFSMLLFQVPEYSFLDENTMVVG